MRSVHGVTASLVAFVFLITVTSAGACAEDTAIARPAVDDGETGVLLLQDGGVLTGQITCAADWYVLGRGSGQMQIAKSRVQVACRTLEEAYEFRRQQINGDKAADHLRLAEWCIRYELRADAGRELAEARRLEPDQPRLALLERRLAKEGSRPVVREVVKESVYLAGVSSRAKPQAANVAPPAHAGASELPAGAVELFTRKVQPVLVNNCTTSGCHQIGSKQSFQLERAILRGESNRRTTMRNLEAALALVDRAHPDQSPLLTVPRKSHGGTAGPIFGPRQEQAYKHLVDWVGLVAPSETAPIAPDATTNSEGAKGVAPMVQSIRKIDGESMGAAPLRSKRQFALHAEAAADNDRSMTLKSPHRLQVGAQVKTWQPRDEFDPEIFNRGQLAREQGQANLSMTQPVTREPAPTAETR
jgi:hypothetical protein